MPQLVEGPRRRTERLAREEFTALDVDPLSPATQRKYEHCNACRYPFAKKDGVIDMNDFRRHKQACGRILRF